MIEVFPPLKMIASKKRIINQFWVVSNRKRGRNQSKPTKHPTRCRKITRFQSISWIFKGFFMGFHSGPPFFEPSTDAKKRRVLGRELLLDVAKGSHLETVNRDI
jgi:hypothetical protein